MQTSYCNNCGSLREITTGGEVCPKGCDRVQTITSNGTLPPASDPYDQGYRAGIEAMREAAVGWLRDAAGGFMWKAGTKDVSDEHRTNLKNLAQQYENLASTFATLPAKGEFITHLSISDDEDLPPPTQYTSINHEHNGDGTARAEHCCGCYNIRTMGGELWMVCNECGEADPLGTTNHPDAAAIRALEVK